MNTFKKVLSICLLAITFVPFFSSCSDDDDSSIVPAEKLMIYPTSLIEKNVSADGTSTTRTWGFTYNNDNKISSYSKDEHIIGNNITIVETTSGELNYYTHVDMSSRITNDKQYYYSYSDVTNPTSKYAYSEEVRETSVLENGYIKTIDIVTKRTSIPDSTQTTLTSSYSFTYAGDYCTGCTYKTQIGNEVSTSTYQFSWNGTDLIKAQVNDQDNSNNINFDSYAYTWNTKAYATIYTFNISAFILGPTPQLYAAMGLLGKSSTHLLQKEVHNGYRIISGDTRQKNTVTKTFSFFDNTAPSTVTVTVSSPSYSEYTYSFK